VIGSNQTPGNVLASPPAEPSPALPPEMAPLPVPPVAPPARRPGFFRRVREWFWRSRALAALREQGRIGPQRAQEFVRRAWLCVELSERALRPVPRLLSGAGDGPARELARQGVVWALLAERTMRAALVEPELVGAPELGEAPNLAVLWAEAEPGLLASAAGDEGSAHALAAALKVDGFVEFADLSAEEQARQARDLATFTRTLLTNIEAPRVRLDKVYFQRILRTGGALVLLAGLVVLGWSARNWSERERDIARGRPYKTSSTYPGVGCKSPDQDCPESPFYFFHTLDDERPWVEIDLGGKRRFSAVRLINREDCCGERAVPLAIEVSTDHKTWREIARRDDTFNTWYKDFPPVTAHYVRAIALHKTLLHLRRFSILR
jgi:F5/8 type C domain